MPSVSLRPVRESDLEYFDLWGSPEADVFNFFGFRTPHRARRAFGAQWRDGAFHDLVAYSFVRGD